MKNKKLFILPLVAAFGLAACGGGKTNPPPDPDPDNWSEEVQEEMLEVLGELLPYVALTEETLYFDSMVQGSVGAFVIGDETETNLLEGYGDLLEEAGFEEYTYQGSSYYAKLTEDGDELYVQFGWFEATEEYEAGNEIYAEIYYAPETYDSLPIDEIVAFYESFGIEEVDLVDYETAEGSFQLLEDYTDLEEGFFALGVYDSSSEEMEAWAQALTLAGWNLTTDSYGDYSGLFGDTLAEIYIGNYIGMSLDCIVIQFTIGVEFSSEWPAEDISAIFEENEYQEYAFPAFVGEAATFYAETYLYWGLIPSAAQVTVRGATEEEISAFLTTTLPEAGWAVTGSAEDGIATKVFEEYNGVATVEFYDDDDFIILLDFGFSAIPGAEFPHEALAEAFEALGVTPFTIPEPDGEGYTYEYAFDEYNLDYVDYPNYCYDNMYINNMSEDQFNAYIEKLHDAGWEGEANSSGAYELRKHFEEGFTATIRLSWYDSETYGQYASLRIYYIVEEDPSTEWPAEEIAEILGSDVTDVLPEFVFEGAGFVPYNDSYGKGVSCFVGEENIEAAMKAYAGVLVEAGFHYDEESGLYASPNNQFFVEIYEGTDGAVGLEFTFPLLPGFIGRNAESFLASRGVESATLPDFSSLEDIFLQEQLGTYGYRVYFEGDVVETVLDLIETAGYSVPDEPSSWGYECISADGLVEIDVNYSESYKATSITFYATADLSL